MFIVLALGLLASGCMEPVPYPFIRGEQTAPPSACPDGCKLKQALQAVLDEAFSQHTYITDFAKYGVQDDWRPELEGDCESFALWLRNRLAELGIESDLMIARTEEKRLHTVVSVGGWILDNRYRWVMNKDELDYEWIKMGRPDGRWYLVK